MDLPALNFPLYRFRLTLRAGQHYIWDPLRGCWLKLTPEEWVRQHTVRWLVESKDVVAQYITQEYPVCLQGMPQRADLVVTSRDMHPLLLVECKGPGITVDQHTLEQAIRYNTVVQAKYLMLTNGLQHYFYESGTNYIPLSQLPEDFSY